MDDSGLKACIQKLTKRLLPLFEDAPEAEDRIQIILDQPEIGPDLARDLGVVEVGKREVEAEAQKAVGGGGEIQWPRKNEDLAKRMREDGNSAFTAGNLELAVTLYTEAMKYSPVHETLWEGETMAISAANRSACYFALKNYMGCLTDINLALEAGYPTNLVYKLYIRQCKCLLEQCKIAEAQEAFDKAVDAIDRSGLKKDARKETAAGLQEAFINLAKSVEDDPPPESVHFDPLNPPWIQIKQPHKIYTAASEAVSMKYEQSCGRHMVANRDIEVGEVVFNEMPIVSYLNSMDEDTVTTPACHHCLLYIKSALVPCPTCSKASFCSIECRNEAARSYHKFECRISLALERTQLDRLPLVMASLRAIAQRPLAFFTAEAEAGVFTKHDILNGLNSGANSGAEPESELKIYRSDDYANLYNLVTHAEHRNLMDIVTKYIIAGVLLALLKSAGYFSRTAWVIGKDELLIGKLLAHFLQCIQFNMHMVEGAFSNRLIAPDSETRIWKNASKFCIGEFVETTPLGGSVYPTLANVNHSCDPNLTLISFGKRTVAFATRKIKAGDELHDSYGAVYFHMDKNERQQFLQSSYWFECGCPACVNNWPCFMKLPRDYLKLSGANFRYKRCNRKELQKDVDKMRKRIRKIILDETVPASMTTAVDGAGPANHFEAARRLFHDWMNLLDELLIPPGHQDFINVIRGIRTCLWLQSPNMVKVKESDLLKQTKEKYKEKTAAK